MIARKYLKSLVAFAVVFAVMVFGMVVANANTVNPSYPGDTRDTAWAFNNTINITQLFTDSQDTHFYR